MATFTTNYDLIKPGNDDYYDIADFNENMDAIDGQLSLTEQEVTKVKEEVEALKNSMGQNESLSAIDKKIGTPADQTNTTLFGAIAVHKKATDATDKKIGTATDQSTNTLFGLLKTLQAQRKFYRYSKTDKKLGYENVAIFDGTDSHQFKIHTFHAKYDGSIHVKLDMHGLGKPLYFYIADLAHAGLVDLADKTAISSNFYLDTKFVVYQQTLYNESENIRSGFCDIVLPVQAGHIYHFVTNGFPYRDATISSFELFYTEETA